jgi:GNAT superfamily N-acetyltransferase
VSDGLRQVGQPDPTDVRMVRPARPEDVDEIVEVTLGAWREGFRDVVPEALTPDEAEMTERLDHRIREAARPVAVAELHGRIRGSIVFGPSRDPSAGPEVGEIHALYVHPSAWRRGLGRALVEYALWRLGDGGFEEAMLWAFAETPSSHVFYEALGFANDGGTQRRQMSGGALEIRYRLTL